MVVAFWSNKKNKEKISSLKYRLIVNFLVFFAIWHNIFPLDIQGTYDSVKLVQRRVGLSFFQSKKYNLLSIHTCGLMLGWWFLCSSMVSDFLSDKSCNRNTHYLTTLLKFFRNVVECFENQHWLSFVKLFAFVKNS